MARIVSKSFMQVVPRPCGAVKVGLPVQFRGLVCLALLGTWFIWRNSHPEAIEFLRDTLDEDDGDAKGSSDDRLKVSRKAEVVAGHCEFGRAVTPHDFGAQGDGEKDDTSAVLKAFRYGSHCKVIVCICPKASMFYVSPGKLKVQLRNVVVRFEGHLLGPSIDVWNPHMKTWPPGSCAYAEPNCSRGGPSPEYARSRWALLHIRNSSHFSLEGPGGIRAPGWTFWRVRYERAEVRGYCLLKLEQSHHVHVSGLTLEDSPMYQFIIMQSRRVELDSLSIRLSVDKVVFGKDVGKWGPENTDGVSIFASQDVNLRNSEIDSGDDNVAIKEASRGIVAEGLSLHNGKGISVGSLGETWAEHETVDVLFRNVRVDHCRHGVRIKTWRGGRGVFRNASFEDFRLSRVRVGIMIDQAYCPLAQRPEGCAASNDAVSIENVTFRSFVGTYTRSDGAAAKKITCVRCSGIIYDGIDMREHPRPTKPPKSIS